MKIGDMIEATDKRLIFLGLSSAEQEERMAEVGDLFVITDVSERINPPMDDKYKFSVDIYDIKSCQYAYGFYLFDLQNWTKIVD